MRIWLHEVIGNESGWNAWCLDLLGFATWSPTEVEVMSRLPTKATEYRAWLERHHLPAEETGLQMQVVERIQGNEVLFSPDTHPCQDSELNRTAELLAASRDDLIATVSCLPEGALDWDPPYRSFAEWASWRSVRAILAHIANTETHYYLPNVCVLPTHLL